MSRSKIRQRNRDEMTTADSIWNVLIESFFLLLMTLCRDKSISSESGIRSKINENSSLWMNDAFVTFQSPSTAFYFRMNISASSTEFYLGYCVYFRFISFIHIRTKIAHRLQAIVTAKYIHHKDCNFLNIKKTQIVSLCEFNSNSHWHWYDDVETVSIFKECKKWAFFWRT